jgi:hypothetical protein
MRRTEHAAPVVRDSVGGKRLGFGVESQIGIRLIVSALNSRDNDENAKTEPGNNLDRAVVPRMREAHP